MWHAVMADEASNISDHEQVTVCILWMYKYYKVYEDFIGHVNVPNVMTEAIYFTLPVTIARLLRSHKGVALSVPRVKTNAGKRSSSSCAHSH